MPSTQELLILIIAIFALWFVLKLAKVAIQVIFYIITFAVIAGVLWYVITR